MAAVIDREADVRQVGHRQVAETERGVARDALAAVLVGVELFRLQQPVAVARWTGGVGEVGIMGEVLILGRVFGVDAKVRFK